MKKKYFRITLLLLFVLSAFPKAYGMTGLMFFPFPDTDFKTPCVGGVDDDSDGRMPNIFDVENSSNYLYVAGSFTHVGKCGAFAMQFSTSTGLPSWSESASPIFNGAVADALPDGSGGFFVWGRFSTVNGVLRNGFARINADGSLHPLTLSLGFCTVCVPELSSNVIRQVIFDPARTALFILGTFDSVNGELRKFVAKVDANTGAVNPSFVVNLNCPATFEQYLFGCPAPTAIGFNPTDNVFYISGDFPNINGAPRLGLAGLNGNTGAPIAWNPSPGCNLGISPCLPMAFMGPVQRIDWFNNILYLSGTFNVISGANRNGAAAYNTPTYALNAFNPNPSNSFLPSDVHQKKIYQFLRDGSDLVVVGKFTSIGGQPRAYLARLDPVTGLARTSFNAGAVVNTIVHSSNSPIEFGGGIFINGTTLYVAGDFYSFGSTARFSVAALNKDTGALLAWDPKIGGTARKVIASATDAFVVGEFTTYQAAYRPKIAKVNMVTGAADPDFYGPVAPGIVVTDLLLAGSSLYASNIVMSIPDQSWVMKLDTNSGVNDPLFSLNFTAPLGGAVAPKLIYDSSTNSLFAAGGFSTVNGSVSRNLLAKLSAATGSVAPFNLNIVGSRVADLVLSGGALYLGGSFSSVAGSAINHLAKVDANSGALIASWNPNPNGPVEKMYLENSTLLFGYLNSVVTPSYVLAKADVVSGALTPFTVAATNPIPLLVGAGKVFTRTNNMFGALEEKPLSFDWSSGSLSAWSPNLWAYPSAGIFNNYFSLGYSYSMQRRSGSGQLAFLYGSFVRLTTGRQATRVGVNQVDLVTGAVNP